jgi:hypothetical protein
MNKIQTAAKKLLNHLLESSELKPEIVDGIEFYFDTADPEEMELTISVPGHVPEESVQEKAAEAFVKTSKAADLDIHDAEVKEIVKDENGDWNIHLQWPWTSGDEGPFEDEDEPR